MWLDKRLSRYSGLGKRRRKNMHYMWLWRSRRWIKNQ